MLPQILSLWRVLLKHDHIIGEERLSLEVDPKTTIGKIQRKEFEQYFYTPQERIEQPDESIPFNFFNIGIKANSSW